MKVVPVSKMDFEILSKQDRRGRHRLKVRGKEITEKVNAWNSLSLPEFEPESVV